MDNFSMSGRQIRQIQELARSEAAADAVSCHILRRRPEKNQASYVNINLPSYLQGNKLARYSVHSNARSRKLIQK